MKYLLIAFCLIFQFIPYLSYSFIFNKKPNDTVKTDLSKKRTKIANKTVLITNLKDTIQSEIIFDNDTVAGNSHIFDGNYFTENVTFNFTLFKNSSVFENLTFLRNFEFRATELYKPTSFFHDTFFKRFTLGTFDSLKMELRSCFFYGDLDISNCHIKKLFLLDSRLPPVITFTQNEDISQIVDFTAASFDGNQPKHQINLVGSDISKIKIDYEHFVLFFDPYGFSINEFNKQKETTYLHLLKNFKDNEQIEDYKKLDIEYHQFQFDKIGLHWVGKFFDSWWQFGYAKERIFNWVLAFLSVFTLINLFLLNFLNNHVYRMANVPTIKTRKYLQLEEHTASINRLISITGMKSLGMYEFKQFRRRCWYSFVYTTSVFFKLTLKIENLKFNNWPGVLYLMLIYTSGLLSLAYLANYVLNK